MGKRSSSKKRSSRGRSSAARRRAREADVEVEPDQDFDHVAASVRRHAPVLEVDPDVEVVTAPGGIVIELYGHDGIMHQAAVEYWSRDGRGRYLHQTAPIAQRLGVRSATTLPRHLRLHARAYDPALACPTCGKTTLLDSRNVALRVAGRTASPCNACSAADTVRTAGRAEIERWCRELLADQQRADEAEIILGDLVAGYGLLALLTAHRGEGTVIRVEDFLTYDQGEPTLIGTAGLDANLLADLVRRGYLTVDPSSPSHAFAWDETGAITGWHPLKAHYTTPWTDQGPAHSAGLLTRNLRTVRHTGEVINAWYRVIGADAAGFLSAMMRWRYGCPPASPVKDEEVVDAVVRKRPAFDPGQLAAVAWSAAQYGFGAASRYGGGRKNAGSSAAGAMVRWLTEPKTIAYESYKRQPLLHPWPLTARLFLEHHFAADPADWQHTRAEREKLRPEIFCPCELATDQDETLAGWPSGYHRGLGPTLEGARQVYRAVARRQATAPTNPEAVSAFQEIDARWRAELATSGVDVGDDLARAWIGVMCARALIHTRMMLDLRQISFEGWCEAHHRITSDLEYAARHDLEAAAGAREHTRTSIWSQASDQQRTAVGAWLRDRLQQVTGDVDAVQIDAAWHIIEHPEPEYRPPAAQVPRQLPDRHWTTELHQPAGVGTDSQDES